MCAPSATRRSPAWRYLAEASTPPMVAKFCLSPRKFQCHHAWRRRRGLAPCRGDIRAPVADKRAIASSGEWEDGKKSDMPFLARLLSES